MNRIFSDAKDLYVETTFVYINGEGNLYWDAEFTKPLNMAEAKEMFYKGMTIVANEEGVGLYYTPVFMADAGTSVKIVYYNTSSAQNAWTVDSEH